MTRDMSPQIEESFRLSARIVDAEVMKGRSLDEVLAEHADNFWFTTEGLRPHSAAIAADRAQKEAEEICRALDKPSDSDAPATPRRM